MKCPRCAGLMTMEINPVDTITILQWRCINCGNLLEPDLVPIKKLYWKHGWTRHERIMT